MGPTAMPESLFGYRYQRATCRGPRSWSAATIMRQILNIIQSFTLMDGEDKILRVYVVYSTETGNAKQLALHTCIKLPDTIHAIIELDEQFQFQDHCLYIFFISTTGQGDPPSALRPFWKMLMTKSFKTLQRVKFCVYGLGDRTYGQNFNLVARKFRQRLLMLQAQQIFEICLGDEQDYNGCFHQYLNTFYPGLSQYLGNHDIPPSKLIVKTKGAQGLEKCQQIWKIMEQKSISSEQGRDICWVTLELIKPQLFSVKIGHVLEIYPESRMESVQQMVSYFKTNKLNDVGISESELKAYLKTKANLDNFVNFTFFSARQGQSSLSSMVDQYIDPNIRSLYQQKLGQLESDYNEYYNYIKRNKRNVREVLVDFCLKMPLSGFMRRLGSIIPRKYSIARIDPQQRRVSLLLKLEKHTISSNRVIKGLCTHDLAFSFLGSVRSANLKVDEQFTINMHASSNLNLTMISLGTGIAPFLSILDEVLRNNYNWQIRLFHSNRYTVESPLSHLDFLSGLGDCKNIQVLETFTREQESVQTRRLQVLIKQNLPLIEACRHGKIMICGAKQFCSAVCRILEEGLGFDIKKMQKAKIICIENW